MLNKEHINTLELADKGYTKFKDDAFLLIRDATMKEIKKNFFHKNLLIEFKEISGCV